MDGWMQKSEEKSRLPREGNPKAQNLEESVSGSHYQNPSSCPSSPGEKTSLSLLTPGRPHELSECTTWSSSRSLHIPETAGYKSWRVWSD